MMAIAIEVTDISYCDEGDNGFVRYNGDGDGSYGYCLMIETVMHVIDVIAMVMEVLDPVIGLKL